MRSHVGAVRARLDEFGDETDLVLITFTDPDNLPAYLDRHALDMTVVVDRSRTSYAAFGLGRGSVWRVWGWRAAIRYVELFRTDGISGLRRPTEDTLQLGGDFIVGPDGTLLYGFWGDGPDDRPHVDDLLRALDHSKGSAPD